MLQPLTFVENDEPHEIVGVWGFLKPKPESEAEARGSDRPSPALL